MSKPIEDAVRAYVAAWGERDPATRAKLLDACWAVEGRLVTSGAPICGRAALDARISAYLSDPRSLPPRLTSPVDVQGTMFRFCGVLDLADGKVAEAFDAGEVDSDGRIALLLTFKGQLPEA
jgi:hypothetical protein